MYLLVCPSAVLTFPMRSLVIVGITHVAIDVTHFTGLNFIVGILGDKNLLSLFNARILFNMKELGERNTAQGTDLSSISIMDFTLVSVDVDSNSEPSSEDVKGVSESEATT